MRKLFIVILLFCTAMSWAQQALAEYDFSGLMKAPERTYLATFYDDHIRFDVKVPEKNWTATAITDNFERQKFLRLLSCKKNPNFRNNVLRDYLSYIKEDWGNSLFHEKHHDYMELYEGYMDYILMCDYKETLPVGHTVISDEIWEMEQAEIREIELAKKRARDEKAKQEAGTVLMAAIMARMLGGFLGAGNGYEFNGQRFNNEAEMEDYKNNNGYK